MKINVVVIIGIAFLIVGLIGFIFYAGYDIAPNGKYVVLIATPITITTFAVTFSFLQYQFASYKTVAFKLTNYHVIISVGIVFFSLIPFYSLFISESYIPITSVIVTPITGLLLVFLLGYSHEATNPDTLIKRISTVRRSKDFIKRYQKKWNVEKENFKIVNFNSPGETPMHDISDSKYINVVIENHLYELYREIILLAIVKDDVKTFQISISEFLSKMDVLAEFAAKESTDYFFEINRLSNSYFESILLELGKNNSSKLLQNELLKLYASYIKKRIVQHEKIGELHLNNSFAISKFAAHVLEQNNDDAAIFVMSLNRQIVQQRIKSKDLNEVDYVYDNHILSLVSGIQLIGQAAVKIKNSDVVYRALEDLGYLGCTAMKHNESLAVTKCLQAIVQLGRESRAINLKCFWVGCALESSDHAEQRIYWIMTWLHKVPSESQKRYLDSFNTAYSRLRGKKVLITYKREGEESYFTLKNTEENYVESIIDGQYNRTVDYSDPNEIKELRLY